ncbi:MAG TPA: threonine/serine dehydratase [Candidatus Limnocylindria bacterium]|nr:threonine/serine dehydratase [Candidatus Limnocylindria bacterium]
MGGDLHRLRAEGRPVSEHEVMARVAALRSEAVAGVAGVEHDAPPVPELVSIDAIRRAAANLAGVANRTPLVPFGVAGRDGPQVLLKAESLQPIGAFKIRGAYHAIASLAPAERRRGVVTHSSGNHAQGVARAARLLGIHAVIVMPSDAPAIKRGRVEADGAEIVIVGPASGEREAKAEELARERGLEFVPPYDDDRIIAGQGTVGLEIAEDVPDLAAVLVPIGGGGLSSGVAVAIRALHPSARLIGVEPELAADAQQSLREGRIVRWDGARTGSTIADGVRSQAIGKRPFAHLSRLLDDVVTVPEAEIAAGVRLIAEEARLVVEPSGALAPAAARFRAREAGIAGLQGTVVAVVSGGNVDPERYRDLLGSPLPEVR